MSERLGALDMAFLVSESASAPTQVATIDVFDPGEAGFDYSRLVALVADRIGFVPRYRQRLQGIPGGLANPIWVDDAEFDLRFHVRESALPRPGSMGQLRDLVGRIMSRRLDRSRPLWEIYLIEGIEGGRFALLAKSHQALIDETTVDIAQLLLDPTPDARRTPEPDWRPQPASSPLGLVTGSLAELATHPGLAVDTFRAHVAGLKALGNRVRGGLGAVLARPPATAGPLSADLSEQRRLLTIDTPLASYRKVRGQHGGTVNDVILTTIAGALRSWLLTRAEPVSAATRLRALVPLSVTDDERAEPTALGSQLTPQVVVLPVGEANPVVRLHQVSYSLQDHVETGHAVAATRLAGLAGFAPTTFHALGARLAARHSARSYSLLVTNVPGPQFPLYAAGSRLVASYPVLPLVSGQPVAIGVTSYDGMVFYGISADRDAVPDLDVLGQCIVESLDELVDVSSPGRDRAPRGRLGGES